MPDESKKSFLDRVREMGTEAGYEGDELDSYIAEHAERRGMKRVTTWEEPDDDSGRDKGPSWRKGGGQSKPRGSGGGGGNRSSSDW